MNIHSKCQYYPRSQRKCDNPEIVDGPTSVQGHRHRYCLEEHSGGAHFGIPSHPRHHATPTVLADFVVPRSVRQSLRDRRGQTPNRHSTSPNRPSIRECKAEAGLRGSKVQASSTTPGYNRRCVPPPGRVAKRSWNTRRMRSLERILERNVGNMRAVCTQGSLEHRSYRTVVATLTSNRHSI